MRCRLGALALALCALALAACTPGLCSRHSDCATGQVCTVEGVCAAPPDAGTDDATDAATSGKLGDATAGPDAP